MLSRVVITPPASSSTLKELAKPASRTARPSLNSSTQISPEVGRPVSFQTPIDISRTAARLGALPRSASTTA